MTTMMMKRMMMMMMMMQKLDMMHLINTMHIEIDMNKKQINMCKM